MSHPPPHAHPQAHPLTALLAKYDTALSLYDDLAHDITQMKKATQRVRAKTLRLFAAKARRKNALAVQQDALDVLLAAGVKAQQRRKGTGPRRARSAVKAKAQAQAQAQAKLGSPAKHAKRRDSAGGHDPAPAPGPGPRVHFDVPDVPGPDRARSVHVMATRRSRG